MASWKETFPERSSSLKAPFRGSDADGCEAVERGDGALGFVFGGDLFDRTSCPSSDEGELTYLIVPDPNGEFGSPVDRDPLLQGAPRLIAHEFTHMIQQGRRVAAGNPFLDAWYSEGQAVLAEEVVGHAVTGRTTHQNYGGDVAWNFDGSDEQDWYRNRFTDLAVYYGFETNTSKVEGAPEECTWLVRGWGTGAPCIGPRSVYGTPSSLLRWISDHLGPDRAGGEEAIHRDLVDSDQTGFALLEELTGEPVEDLLAQWAAMLWVDGRVAGAEERLTLPSWDMFDVFQSVVESARLLPRERAFQAFTDTLEVNGASAGYFRLSGGTRPALALRFRDGADGRLPGFMQLWVVRLE